MKRLSLMAPLLVACSSPSSPSVAAPPPKPDAGPAAIDFSRMAQITSGTFPMGHADATFGGYGSEFKENEFPQRRVTLGDYWIDRDEVSVAEYAAFLNAFQDARRFDPMQPIAVSGSTYVALHGFEDQPIMFVSWADAHAFCGFAGKSLPSEAQWERAAKGPARDPRFPWGDTEPSCRQAVFLAGSMCEPWPTSVGGRSPAGDSAEGVRDLAGNVAEWIADWYDRYPGRAPETDPTGPDNADGSLTLRVMRGGGFRDPSPAIRTTARWGAHPQGRAEGVGFRCAYRE